MGDTLEHNLKLEKLKQATCLIQAGGCNATGFHFGRGWVMTVAHIFQEDQDDNNRDPDYVHSCLSGARFVFRINGDETVFDTREKRVAFIHHLRAGDQADTRNEDIAMVKLGKHTEYSGLTNARWEEEEERELKRLNLESFAKPEERSISPNEEVHTIYNKLDDDMEAYIREIVRQTVASVIPRPNRNQAATPNDNLYPYINLQPAIENGVESGAPILNKDLMLVGLMYSGDSTESSALQWNSGIEEYIQNGVEIMPIFESCLLEEQKNRLEGIVSDGTIPSKFEKELKEIATANKLSIYLMDKGTITGTE